MGRIWFWELSTFFYTNTNWCPDYQTDKISCLGAHLGPVYIWEPPFGCGNYGMQIHALYGCCWESTSNSIVKLHQFNTHTNSPPTSRFKIWNQTNLKKYKKAFQFCNFGYFYEADLCSAPCPATYSYRMTIDFVFTGLLCVLWYFMSWLYFQEHNSHLVHLCFQCCCSSHNIIDMINLTSFQKGFEIDIMYKKSFWTI